MPRMTPSEFYAYEAKRAPRQPALIPTADDAEADLHDWILTWARRQDPPVPVGHGSMAHKARRTPGEADFYLMLPGGKLLMVECKSADGQLSDDQKAWAAACLAVGHKVHVAHSYIEFLEIVKGHLEMKL